MIDEAYRRGEVVLRTRIDEVSAAISDPDEMRALLKRFRSEVEAARAQLTAAAEPEWCIHATVEQIGDI